MASGEKAGAYPLEALLDLREQKVEATTAELADAVRHRERAASERRSAEIAARRAAEDAADKRVLEQEALLRGELKVADLARFSTWEVAVQAEQHGLAARVEQATEEERRAKDAEERSRSELAQRKADADVVDKDRSRYLDQMRKRIEAKEEEDAVDTVAWRRR
jgi:hypothetical protein